MKNVFPIYLESKFMILDFDEEKLLCFATKCYFFNDYNVSLKFWFEIPIPKSLSEKKSCLETRKDLI